MKNKRLSLPSYFRIPLIYILTGGLWILLTDILLSQWISNANLFAKISIYKGLFFVIFTALLLYVLVRLEGTRQEKFENQYQMLFEVSPEILIIIDSDGCLRKVNQNAVEGYGYSREELLAINISDLFDPRQHEYCKQQIGNAIEQGQHSFECQLYRKDGSPMDVHIRSQRIEWKGEVCLMNSIRDMTGQVLLTRQRDNLLQQMQLILDRMPIGCIVNDADNRITLWNPAAEKIFGFTAQEAVGKTQFETILPEGMQDTFRRVKERMTSGDMAVHIQYENVTKEGRTIICEWYNTPLFDNQGSYLGFLGMVQDITERRRSENEAQLQLQRLEALREIGTAITASLDLDITLDILLNHTTNQLQADAAAVLLYDAPTQSLRYARSRGLRPQALDSAPMFLGKGYAGQVALTRQMMSVQLNEAELARKKNVFSGEGFQTYIGIPLIAKSQIKGVLEIYHRNTLEPPEGWLGYLQIMAEQAAIAIENIQMFENLQRANLDLGLAYDTTIEGWSRALDLRDQGTGGHSRRLADISLRLARQMGMSDVQLQHIYRGSLLHDIGKVAVPDSILLKKGSLTEEEWQVMRKHPSYAFELLSPIGYLRPALDIPYCHHERWDGTGYPRGLRGAEIPLAARIFTVVDVWDALLEDRSYRPAWQRERAVAYLKEQSGKLFDPQVVDLFLSSILEEDHQP